jgi:predicted RNase H-like nuclease
VGVPFPDEQTDGVGHRKLVFAGPAGGRRVKGHVRVASGRDRYAGPPVLGVDGCKTGWVGALLTPGGVDVLVARRIGGLVDEALRREPDLEVVAVDIPIGLPDERPRAADRLARQRLPPGRTSSVFPTPARAAVAEATHPEASAANRAALGVGLSIQAFHLVPKILDVDGYVGSGPPVTVLEAHPEVCFAEIDPDCVRPSKLTSQGAAERTAALRSVGLEPPAYVRGQGYSADDLLDACVVARTAARYAAGEAFSLPDPPERFSDSIAAAIWV